MQLEAGDQAAATSNLQSLLKRSAQLYTSLTELASAAAVDVPEEAQLSAGNAKADDEPPGPRILQWSDFVAAGAADWEDFEDEGRPAQAAMPSAACIATNLYSCSSNASGGCDRCFGTDFEHIMCCKPCVMLFSSAMCCTCCPPACVGLCILC